MNYKHIRKPFVLCAYTLVLLVFNACGALDNKSTHSTYKAKKYNIRAADTRYQPSKNKYDTSHSKLASQAQHAVRIEKYNKQTRADYPSLTNAEIDAARAQLSVLSTQKVVAEPVLQPVESSSNAMPTIKEKQVQATTKKQTSAPKTRPTGQVAPGYLVQLVALEDEKLNGRFRIGFNEKLKLPYGVSIDTSRLSETQLSDAIVNAYRKYFRTDPSMQISIVERDLWVDVRGLVKESGKFLVKEDTSLDEVLAKAGGLQRDNASNALAQFVRINQLGIDTALINMDDYYAGTTYDIPQWQGGDTVFAQTRKPQLDASARASFGGMGISANHVQLVGQVRHPGKLVFKDNADFFYYLVQAGGPTEKADLNRLFVVRNVNGEKRTIKVDLEKLEEQPRIQAGDLLILNGDVPGSEEKRLNFFSGVSQIITSIASVIVLGFAI